ncbi:hypothetical protein EDB83DRAFT_1868322 [Lactarius deliciosus]|nr:hypothetical protein EDB83DRAFT_1868322 [Lactarius deliciosus]
MPRRMHQRMLAQIAPAFTAACVSIHDPASAAETYSYDNRIGIPFKTSDAGDQPEDLVIAFGSLTRALTVAIIGCFGGFFSLFLDAIPERHVLVVLRHWVLSWVHAKSEFITRVTSPRVTILCRSRSTIITPQRLGNGEAPTNLKTFPAAHQPPGFPGTDRTTLLRALLRSPGTTVHNCKNMPQY